MRQKHMRIYSISWKWGCFGVLLLGIWYLRINTHFAIIHPNGHKRTVNVFWLPNHQDDNTTGPDFTFQL